MDAEQKEFNKVMGDYDKLLIREAKKFVGPKCHFTPMHLEHSDYESWWECPHCGHTKPCGFMDRPF